jgi:hypothetical protein
VKRKIRTLKDALANETQQIPWIVKDLLLKDTATLVSAYPHSMKSLSLVSACMDAVAKKQVWGHFAAPTVEKSLFIETEDPEWLVEARIRGFAKGLEIKDDLPGFLYSCVGVFDLVQKKEQIICLLELNSRYYTHHGTHPALDCVVDDYLAKLSEFTNGNAHTDIFSNCNP